MRGSCVDCRISLLQDAANADEAADEEKEEAQEEVEKMGSGGTEARSAYDV